MDSVGTDKDIAGGGAAIGKRDGDSVRVLIEAIDMGIQPEACIAEAAEGNPLFVIEALRVGWENRRGELGYLVFAPARGRAVATRAVRLLARFGFERLGLGRIEILAATANPASQRVAEKAGFTREGVLRSYMQSGGERLDMVSFSLLPDELDAA